MAKILFSIQLALFTQADAKIANGTYWAGIYVDIAERITGMSII